MLQKLNKHYEGRRLRAAAFIMNEAALQFDRFLILQDILRPRKVFDFSEIAVANRALSQLAPLLWL